MVRAESAIRPHKIVIGICHNLSRPISPRADFLALPLGRLGSALPRAP